MGLGYIIWGESAGEGKRWRTQSHLATRTAELVREGSPNCSRPLCWGCGGNLSYVRIGNDAGAFIEDLTQVPETAHRVWMPLQSPFPHRSDERERRNCQTWGLDRMPTIRLLTTASLAWVRLHMVGHFYSWCVPLS